jgi:raffinose/stachyose/melibiose transport system permease protein
MQKNQIIDKLKPIPIAAKSAKWLVLILYMIIAIFPLVWLGISSFKTNLEIEMSPFLLPEVWQLKNFENAINTTGLLRYFLNSIIVAACATALNLFVTSMGSYILARKTFVLRKAIFSILTAGVLIPIIAFMVPYFSTIHRLGLYDSLLGLIVIYTAINIPISIFIIRNFMVLIPRELDDSSNIDGCNYWQQFSKIILPLSRSGLVTAGTFCFIYCWNEFVYALLLTSSRHSRTVQLAIRYFTSQFRTDYAGMFAAIVLTMIPSVIFYIFMNKQIVSGLIAGAVKG